MGRYSPSTNGEIDAALREVTSTFEEIRSRVAGTGPPLEPNISSAPGTAGTLSEDVAVLIGKLYELDRQHSDTDATFNTRSVAGVLG